MLHLLLLGRAAAQDYDPPPPYEEVGGAGASQAFYDGGGRDGDSFSDVHYEGLLEGLGGAFTAAGLGVLLLVGASVLLCWNESQFVRARRRLTAVRAAAVPLTPGKDGAVIFATGRVHAAEDEPLLSDAELHVDAPPGALALRRTVQFFVWQESSARHEEKHLGGGKTTTTNYSYARGWAGNPVDSTNFKRASEHRNPSAFPLAASSWQARAARFLPDSTEGAGKEVMLAKELVGKLQSWEPLPGRGPAQILDSGLK
ncbi:hypothetical protein T484DRAFT_1860894, partial [Baffinella frigidus]